MAIFSHGPSTDYWGLWRKSTLGPKVKACPWDSVILIKKGEYFWSSFDSIFFFSRKRLNELAQGLGPYLADLETSQSFIDGKRVHAANNFLKPIYSVPGSIATQGAKKVIFTACHSGKLKITFTSPNIISTSPKNVLMSRWISRFFCNLNSSKNFTCQNSLAR